jgi:ATP-dependent RNA helicase RhlE
VDIVIACPGRLLDIIGDRAINLTGVEVLVLDEADRMCDMGFLPDIRRLLSHLPKERQTLFFSATMPKEIRKLADGILKDPATVQIGIIAPAKTVSHAVYPVKRELKKDLLFDLLDQTGTSRVLIFTRTKHRAKSLALAMQKRGHRVSALQGNMSQNRRQDAITGFKGGKYDFLVATDIAARGIDVSEISHVINFDMPDTVDAYTHRIGRTGRALQSGEAFTFATTEDTQMLKLIERTLGDPIERRHLPDFDYAKKVAVPERSGANGGGARRPFHGSGANGRRRPSQQRSR